jgi:hypothetical protein
MGENGSELKKQLACPICGERRCDAFNPQSLLFPSISRNKVLPCHQNHLCLQCGVVFMSPIPSTDLLISHYKNAYRRSEYSIEIEGQQVDLPIQFPESGTSFSRFRNFIACVEGLQKSLPNVVPSSKDMMIDIGGYQGMFLYAANQVYGVAGTVVDFNDHGIRFAQTALGFRDSVAIDNVYGYVPSVKARFVSMVHSFEHVDDPLRLLRHIKSQVLRDDGFLYIEVPNLYGSPLNDPVHFFTFSIDSLSYLLNLSGYEVVYANTAGNPHAPLTIANDELVLVCMARPVANSLAPKPNNTDIVRKVQINYAKLSRKAILKQVQKSGSELSKLAYYLFGHFVLEKVSNDLYGAVDKLKKIVGRSIH